MREIRLLGTTYDAVAVAAALGVGVFGALIGHVVGMPLPWLSGAMLAVAAAAMAGLTIQGRPLQFPTPLRFVFVPIIGVAIGGAFTPALVEEATGWWPTLLALVLYIPLAHVVAYQIYRRVGGIDQTTAFFASAPGGLIEAIEMGTEKGANVGLLTLLQFARLMFCILLVPIGIMLVEGVMVGSAAGAEIEGADAAIGLWDVAILTASGALGVIGARRLGFPAAAITGPILLSGLAHLFGLTAAIPPAWMVAATQLVIGVNLGLRFVGVDRSTAFRAIGLAAATILSLLTLAMLFGLAFAGAVGETVEAVVLGFAPGGVVEMSLVAVSLQISVLFVVAHHVARILLSVTLAAVGYRWLFETTRGA